MMHSDIVIRSALYFLYEHPCCTNSDMLLFLFLLTRFRQGRLINGLNVNVNVHVQAQILVSHSLWLWLAVVLFDLPIMYNYHGACGLCEYMSR